jgi:nucleoside-diphosphate-sugar epimerase
MSSSNDHVLVAGGAGFLGSHLCEVLLSRGDKVTSIDNFCTGSLANVKHLCGEPGFSLVDHDITRPFSENDVLGRVLGARKPTKICNLASPASPPTYMQMAIETLHVGSLGMKNLLDLAVETGARILQASTSEVYGDPDVHPQTESYWGRVNPIGPRSMYDESKRFAEALCTAYATQKDVDVRLVRIFNTYGPRLSPTDGRVVTNFIGQALKNEPLTIFGDGEQTRSFCYVDDEIAGIVALLDSDVTGPVNIGNPNEFTMLQLAEIVLALTESESAISLLPKREDDPLQRCPDITRASSLLGWMPKTELREGLQKTIEWFRTLPEFQSL